MNWLKLGMLGCLMVALLAVAAQAEEKTPVAWGGVSSTIGPCGLGFPTGVMAVGGNVVFAKSNGIWNGDERINGNAKTTKLNEIFKVRYGLMDGLDIRTATPIYNVHIERTTTSNRETYQRVEKFLPTSEPKIDIAVILAVIHSEKIMHSSENFFKEFDYVRTRMLLFWLYIRRY